jgi:hypothetical protein
MFLTNRDEKSNHFYPQNNSLIFHNKLRVYR